MPSSDGDWDMSNRVPTCSGTAWMVGNHLSNLSLSPSPASFANRCIRKGKIVVKCKLRPFFTQKRDDTAPQMTCSYWYWLLRKSLHPYFQWNSCAGNNRKKGVCWKMKFILSDEKLTYIELYAFSLQRGKFSKIFTHCIWKLIKTPNL